jgi:uracil-DNA glycosylase
MQKTTGLNSNPSYNTPFEPGWYKALQDELKKEYMRNLREFLQQEYKEKKIIFPPKDQYFTALNETPLKKVKAVIIGQDPYHGPKQAHGLCFSVGQGVDLPPSLKNIFKELESDLGIHSPQSGYLKKWAQQGVLLLNSVLTVEQGKPGTHANRGWEQFTDRIIQTLNNSKKPIVFILWGSYAQKKGSLIDKSKHFIIESAHPSPLSAYRGFFGSRPFSRANEFLIQSKQEPIDWTLNS